MCDSLEEGGTRCATHTRPGFARVSEALLAADPSHRHTVCSGQVPGGESHAQMVSAHAATPRGHREVSDLADQLAPADPTTADWLRHCVRVGETKAEASRVAKTQITRRALTSAIRRIGAARHPHVRNAGANRRWMMAAVERETRARFDTFRAMATEDRTLHAPEGWVERFRATGTHTALIPTDRVTGYALWRTQSTGADFAPSEYDPDSCTRVVTGPDGWRPGDVLDEPGHRSPGNVRHEGKTVAAVERTETGTATVVCFTDGTRAPAPTLGASATVYRPISPAEADALTRYNSVNERAHHRGHIPGRGWYAVDPDTGEHVFDPWGA